jgi:arabinosyltransferase C
MARIDPELEDNRNADNAQESPYGGQGTDPSLGGQKDDANYPGVSGGDTAGPGGPTNSDTGNTSTSREIFLPGSGGAVTSAPPQSSQPRPAQNAASGGSNGAPPSGVIPTAPIAPIGHAGSAGPRLFGLAGGLQGGGIGAMSGTGNPGGDPSQMDISQLLQILQRKRGLF